MQRENVMLINDSVTMISGYFLAGVFWTSYSRCVSQCTLAVIFKSIHFVLDQSLYVQVFLFALTSPARTLNGLNPPSDPGHTQRASTFAMKTHPIHRGNVTHVSMQVVTQFPFGSHRCRQQVWCLWEVRP